MLPSRARDDLAAITAAGLASVSASTLLRRALQGGDAPVTPGRPYTLVAAGKASAAMLERWYALVADLPHRAIGVGTHDRHRVPDDVEWYTGGHPTPTPESVAAADAVLAAARAVPADGRLVVLLSGGASALLCRPVEGVSLAEKQQVTRALMHDGRAIDELNCVRKHLSSIKGGRLAAACQGDTVTLAISDVVAPVEDDPSVIGSGPTVPDPSTFGDAWRIVSGVADAAAVPASVRAWLERGSRGEVAESPKPGDPAMRRSRYTLIGTRHVAMAGAAEDARRRGYDVVVMAPPVLGEAREAGASHVDAVLAAANGRVGPVCVISSGETTVTVTGKGRGGRNQEFVAGAIDALSRAPRPILLSSVGTDGIDGPTDAAGAWADTHTHGVATAIGVQVDRYLADNDAYELHRRLGTLTRTGPTDTNVGDLQISLVY
ncbi:glycerate kinase [Luteitalea sp.]|jgi:hydroxypyruvate reductase|uniref:glycerate kinase n=1 Tax=Luteitalea sp. TaxID=2004800 RepID=UPI0037C694F3